MLTLPYICYAEACRDGLIILNQRRKKTFPIDQGIENYRTLNNGNYYLFSNKKIDNRESLCWQAVRVRTQLTRIRDLDWGPCSGCFFFKNM
jgi:hypothetical protein